MSSNTVETWRHSISNNIERVPAPIMTEDKYPRCMLDAYSSALATVQSPFLDWFADGDISPLDAFGTLWDTGDVGWRRSDTGSFKNCTCRSHVSRQMVPYASTLAGDMLFDEINEICRFSKIGATTSRCEKRMNTAILSTTTKAEIKRIKKEMERFGDQTLFQKST